MRGLLRTVHRWCGLVVAALFLVQAVSGVLWANQERLAPVFHPELRLAAPASPASLDQMLASIHAWNPRGKLDRIALPVYGPGAAAVRVDLPGQGTQVLQLDPGAGRVLSSGPLWAYPEQFAERLHGSLFLGETGRWLLFAEGLVLMLMAVSGLIVWWPGLARLGRALTVRPRGPIRRLVRELHLAPGALAAGFLLVTGLTGALMAAEPLTAALVSRFAPVGADVRPALAPVPPGAAPRTAEQALDALRARYPVGRLVKVRTLGPGDRMVLGVFLDRRPLNPRAYSMVGLDRMTGELTVFVDAARNPPGDVAIAWLTPVHEGAIFGPLRPVAATALGLTLILMVVTGLSNWSLRRRLTARPAR
ncbi:hypothetical protein C5708_13905 [Caulobacter sp. CCUG 60055]|uniref:PepSY-associated TM helix domain-containing protein n=2 Tax=Pseudomonadota TaxID=1224 RepID=UPI001FA7D1F3|nr:PepSY domain-containing protein [Caulobacteraceae bacterium]MCI3181345.1 hypothetical protein [Caulobacter sp. CCUG 60055]